MPRNASIWPDQGQRVGLPEGRDLDRIEPALCLRDLVDESLDLGCLLEKAAITRGQAHHGTVDAGEVRLARRVLRDQHHPRLQRLDLLAGIGVGQPLDLRLGTGAVDLAVGDQEAAEARKRDRAHIVPGNGMPRIPATREVPAI